MDGKATYRPRSLFLINTSIDTFAFLFPPCLGEILFLRNKSIVRKQLQRRHIDYLCGRGTSEQFIIDIDDMLGILIERNRRKCLVVLQSKHLFTKLGQECMIRFVLLRSAHNISELVVDTDTFVRIGILLVQSNQ